MSDSLIIEGKQYISSRRAAEIAGYSNDYVGQLCRAGKLVCRMVGRFWYVDINSILRHKNEFIKPNQTVFKKSDQVQPSNVDNSQTENSSILADKIAQKLFVTPAKAGVQGDTIGISGFSIVNRESSSDANRPVISKLEARAEASIINHQLPAIEPPPEWQWTDLRSPASKALSSIGRAAHSPYALISPTLVAIVFLVFMAATGNSRLQTARMFESVSSLGTASVADAAGAIQSIESAVDGAVRALASAWGSLSSEASELASNIVPLFSSSSSGSGSGSGLGGGTSGDMAINEPSASSVIPPGEQGKVTSEHGGVVVMPSGGSSTDQAKLEKSIQNSFSDTVVVKPNADGTTGVIQPIFRTVAGHDFLYVLVPVKATSTSAVN